MIAALFSVLLVASQTPATTSETTTTSSTTQESAQPVQPTKTAAKEKKTCRVDPANTGSRMKKKICLTAVEWEKHSAGKSAGDLKTIGGR